MSRASKLTENQWQRVHERLLAGEGARALGREFGLSHTAIGRRFGTQGALSAQSAQVRAAAEALAAGQAALEALPLAHRPAALNLAEQLASVSASLAGAAVLGAATAQHLHTLAHAEAARITAVEQSDGAERLRSVAALTATANAASTLPLGLLSANRGTAAGRLQEGTAPRTGVLIVPGVMDEAEWEAMVAKEMAKGN